MNLLNLIFHSGSIQEENMEGVLVKKESKNYLQSNPMTRLSMMMLFYLDNMAAWHRSSCHKIYFNVAKEHSLQL